MEIKSYDPIKVNLNVDGRTITGYADSSMITIAQGEDLVTPTVGAQGMWFIRRVPMSREP